MGGVYWIAGDRTGGLGLLGLAGCRVVAVRTFPGGNAVTNPNRKNRTMEMKKLKKHIVALASLPETTSPVISCYVNLEQSKAAMLEAAKSRAGLVRYSLRGQMRQDFDDAFEEITGFLEGTIQPGARGLAIFSRWGDYPLFLPLHFRVSLEDEFTVAGLPVIYPLVKLKDSFDRFVVVLTTEERARIMEVSAGAVTESLFSEREDLRQRVGREWTKEHYQNHRRDRDERFLKEKIVVIENLMARRGNNHLVLAGTPHLVNRLRNELPKHLARKVVGIVRSGSSDESVEVVARAIDSFVVHEQDVSLGAAELLDAAVRRNALGVVGYEQSRRALREGRADLLVVSQHHEICEERETLVRMAVQRDVGIETVMGSELLDRNGGAGCLLRFKLPESAVVLETGALPGR